MNPPREAHLRMLSGKQTLIPIFREEIILIFKINCRLAAL